MRCHAAVLLLLASGAAAQTPADEPEVFEAVEYVPELIGGVEGLLRRLNVPEGKPPEAREVVVAFVVDERGEVRDARAVDCAMPERWCAAAVAAVEGSRFAPGMARGRPKKHRFTLPVRFPASGDDLGAVARELARRGTAAEIVEVQPVLIGGAEGLRQRAVLPPEAARLGVGGRVLVRVTVGTDGVGRDAQITQGLPRDGLTEAQRAAARQIECRALNVAALARFVPGTVDGEPAPMPVTLAIHF